MKIHLLPDCFAVWYNGVIDFPDGEADNICEQGWADWKLNGINKKDAKRIHP